MKPLYFIIALIAVQLLPSRAQLTPQDPVFLAQQYPPQASVFNIGQIITNGLVFDATLTDGTNTATDIVGALVAPVVFNYNGATAAPGNAQDQWGLGLAWPQSIWMPVSTAQSGINGPIFFADAPSVFDFGTNNFTLECWMSSDQLNTGGINVGIGKISESFTGDFYFLGIDSGGMYFSCGLNGGSPGSTIQTLHGGTSPLDGGLHFFVGVRNNGELYAYEDGTLVASGPIATTTTVSPPNGTYFSIGGFGNYSYTSSTAYNHIGTMSEVAIYNRALSSAEVTSNFNVAVASNIPNFANNCFLMQPINNTHPKDLAVAFHGAGFDGNSLIGLGYNYQLISYGILTNGRSYLCINSPAEGWGNPQDVATCSNALQWAISTYGYTNICLLGLSMGALDAAQLVSLTNNFSIPYLYSYDGVFSLSNMYNNPGSGENFSSQIGEAWGVGSSAALQAAVAGFDPLTIPTNNFGNCTIRVVGSLSDTYVPFLTGGGGAFTNYVPWATARISSGNHIDVSNFVLSDLLNWWLP
jgi:hypothetical protein